MSTEPVNYVGSRYDEFTGQDLSQLISQSVVVPLNSPYYTALWELPREDSPSTVTIRAQGSSSSAAPSEDAYVYEGNPSQNYGGSIFCAAGRDDAGSGGSYKYHALFKFDVSALPAAASLVKFRAYREFGHSSPVFQVHRCTSAWSAGAVNWGNQPTHNAVPEATVNATSQPAWYEWDITALYNAWKAGSVVNNGIMLRTNDVDTDTVSNWTSNEGPSAYRPQLVIVSAGNVIQEVRYNVVPITGQAALHYGTGRLRWPASAAGLEFLIDYFGTGSPIDVADNWTAVPASASSPGRPGQRAADANYLYTCVADNTWRRVAHGTW